MGLTFWLAGDLAHRPGSLAPLVKLCDAYLGARFDAWIDFHINVCIVCYYVAACHHLQQRSAAKRTKSRDPNQLDMIMVRWRGSYGNRIMVIV